MTLRALVVRTRCCNSVQILGTMQDCLRCHLCHAVMYLKPKHVEQIKGFEVEVDDREGEGADPILR